MTPSQSGRKPKGRKIHCKYDRNTYNRAIARGCEIAFEMPADLRYPARVVARLKNVTDKERLKEKTRLEQDAAQWRLTHCWSPNQLRHSRATAIREQYGIEAAQTVLGHADPKITLVYAERDRLTKELAFLRTPVVSTPALEGAGRQANRALVSPDYPVELGGAHVQQRQIERMCIA